MHARHLVTAALLLGMLTIVAPACVVAPEEDIADDAEALADSDPIDVTARFVCKGLDVVECRFKLRGLRHPVWSAPAAPAQRERRQGRPLRVPHLGSAVMRLPVQ